MGVVATLLGYVARIWSNNESIMCFSERQNGDIARGHVLENGNLDVGGTWYNRRRGHRYAGVNRIYFVTTDFFYLARGLRRLL